MDLLVKTERGKLPYCVLFPDFPFKPQGALAYFLKYLKKNWKTYANGLEPVGMAKFRAMLKQLKKEFQTTILISSYILSELYLLATDYLIIHKGKIVEKLTLDELNNKSQKYVRIEMDDVSAGVTALTTKYPNLQYDLLEDSSINLYSDCDIADLAKILSENGILVTQLYVEEQSLEDFYFSVLGWDTDNEQAN